MKKNILRILLVLFIMFLMGLHAMTQRVQAVKGARIWGMLKDGKITQEEHDRRMEENTYWNAFIRKDIDSFIID